MKPSVLVTGRIPSSVICPLEGKFKVDVYTGDSPIKPEELKQRICGKQAVVCLITENIDPSVINAGQALRVIANVGVGYDNIDVAAAHDKGIVVTNTPNVLTEATADLAWALILGITRRIGESERFLRHGNWKDWKFDLMLGMQLHGKQLGIVGFGRIGQAVAVRAKPFGMHAAYASRSVKPVVNAKPMPLEQLLSTSDVVSLHVPLTAETRHLIDKKAIARMKQTAYLINTSRGPIVDEVALAWALEEHLIAGAALDVFEHEPNVHKDLLALDNVLLTPHIGSGTVETRTAMADLAALNVIEVLSGNSPLTPVL